MPPDFQEAQLQQLITAVWHQCRRKRIRLVLAESCTGGMLASLLTSIPGASEVLERGFVTYSNEAKTDLLGVPMPMIQQQGAVSQNVARAMAEGALVRSRAELSVSITGVAGPSGGTDNKPVGLVYFGWATRKNATRTFRKMFEGDRQQIRMQACQFALESIILQEALHWEAAQA